MAASSGTTFSTDPALYIFTSLTAGSAHIVTATSRLETILRANRVPFKAVDLATNEKAKMLWGRRSGKDPLGRVRRLPALAQEGVILGDLTEVDDWNEYGELKQNVKIYYDEFTIPPISQAPKPPAPKPTPKPAAPAAAPKSAVTKPKDKAASPAPAPLKAAMPIRSIADEAAQRAKEMRTQTLKEKVYGKEGAKAKAAEEAGATGAANSDGKAVSKDEGKPGAAVSKGEAESSSEDSEDDEDEEKSKGKGERDAKVAKTAPLAKSIEAEAKDDDEAESEDDSEEEESDAETPKTPHPPKPPSPSTPPQSMIEALQSPTTAAWRPSASDGRHPLQSPTSTSWRSPHGLPIASLHGSLVESASEEKIEAVEKAEAITEEPEREAEEAEEGEEEEEKKEGERRKSIARG